MRKNSEPTSENAQSSSLLDEYSNKVFKLVVLIVPIFFLCGNGTMTVMHYLGYYEDVNDIAMWISNIVDIGYMVTAIFLIKTSYDENGQLIARFLPIAKMALMCMVVIQWNLNSYICPFTDFWAYAPLFVIVQAFFFDVKLVRLSTFLILLSMFVSWFINGDKLLPADNDSFYLNLIFRGVCLAFTLLSINIIAWFGKVFIIEAVASREKERKLREKSNEYEREARMKSDFLANMSHEIRTPMNAVIGMAEIAMREDLTPEAMDCLTQIQKSGRNLLNIINDILDYSKIESGKMEIVPERYEPASELNDISNILATRIGDKELQLYFNIDPDIPHALLGDSMRIRQILINLTNNAIKFTQEGSVGVTVNCEEAEGDVVFLTYHIKDTGIGIKKEDLEKLFVSFQQVDSRRNRSVEGTGLGLAISQQLVQAMGGNVGVDSVYGKGSDFWFTIPQKVLDPSVELTLDNAPGKRGVVLDTDAIRTDIILDELERFGVESDRISELNEYRTSPGKRDYLFFDYRYYDDSIREFLENNKTVTGIVIIDFNSSFKADLDNLHTFRRPITTQKIVRVLNDEEASQLYEEEAFSVNFTAPEGKILIVDDNAINITIAEGLLAPLKMNVDSALSGQEAINKLQEESYDIVLMDHMMPGLDGVDTTKIIRETIPGGDKQVIIALSANALKEAKEMFLEVGMDDFVAKPIEIKELVAKIRKWLPEEKILKGEIVSLSQKTDEEDPLAGFDMLDAKGAAKSLGSPQLFRTIAEEYYKAGQTNYDAIQKAYEGGDLKNYTIMVHALKSSSRQIGAFELGDMAESLEMAGKREDQDYINAHTDEMMVMYKGLLDSMALVFPKSADETEELPMIPEDKKKELLDKLSASCEDMDIDGMEEGMNELKQYSWPSEIRDDLKELCEAIERMEIITCEDILDRIKAQG